MEHDPHDLLATAQTCVEHAVRKLESLPDGYKASDIACIGITNQRETTIAWDTETGEPLYPAIVWSDGRTAGTVQALSAKSDKGVKALQSICGLPLTTYFSAVKLRWMLDHVPRVKEALAQGRLRFSTVDTWLIYVRHTHTHTCSILTHFLFFSIIAFNRWSKWWYFSN